MNDTATKARSSVGNKIRLGVLAVLLLAFLSISGLTLGALAGAAMEDKERGTYLRIAEGAGRECPAVSARIPEFTGDGVVTIGELRVVKTLVDNERARPGGLKACDYSFSVN